MGQWRAPHKIKESKIIHNFGIEELRINLDTPELNKYTYLPVLTSRIHVGEDFYGMIWHPDGKKTIKPEVNQILSVILLPPNGGHLVPQGQYIGYMDASYNMMVCEYDKFSHFDDEARAIFLENGRVGGSDPKKVRAHMREVETEFREPGTEIELEDMLKLHIEHLARPKNR